MKGMNNRCLLFIVIIAFSFSINKKADYSVYIFLHDACLISQFYTLTLDSLHQEFESDNIEFIGVFPNASSKQSDIEYFQEKYQLTFKMIKDEEQLITKRLGAKVTPEVFVVNNKTDDIVYQGRIDNSYFRVGKRRTVTTTSELKDVLSALKNNQKVLTENQIAIGCFIQEL